jgi:hypothetical protein
MDADVDKGREDASAVSTSGRAVYISCPQSVSVLLLSCYSQSLRAHSYSINFPVIFFFPSSSEGSTPRELDVRDEDNMTMTPCGGRGPRLPSVYAEGTPGVTLPPSSFLRPRLTHPHLSTPPTLTSQLPKHFPRRCCDCECPATTPW